MERRLLTVALVVAGGCWTEEPLIHGAFTADQWAKIQDEYRFKQLHRTCNRGSLPAVGGISYDCEAAADLGQMLFFEPRLSLGSQTSCSTCHAATAMNGEAAWYVDLRSDNRVSMGALKPTTHNAMSLVNIEVPIAYDAEGNYVSRQHYGWTGQAMIN